MRRLWARPSLSCLLPLAMLGCGHAGPPPPPRPASPAAEVARPAPAAATATSPAPPRCTGGACVGWVALLLSGGGDVSDNAVAHERNVSFAGRTLASLGLPASRQTLLFADGDDPDPDLSYEEPDAERHRRLYAMGLWLTPEAYARTAVLRARNHSLGPSRPADRETVLETLADDAEAARRAFGPGGGGAEGGARDLFFYVTDHGVRGRELTNNLIVLWGSQHLRVRDLGAALDRQPPARRVVTVMAQCFSGSFAGLVYEGGDPRRPPAAHDRCGFFAAPPDRPAAGCSPKTDESLYDDYTTRFFSALGGADRAGRPAPAADLNDDGRVSYEEAHFAAVRWEQTMDVPVSTSEEMLRRRYEASLRELAADRRPIAEVMADARVELRAVAASLAAALELPRSTSLRALRRRHDEALARCWPGLCEAESALTGARLRAHQTLRRNAAEFGLSPPSQRPDLTLALLGPERAGALLNAARPDLERVARYDALVDRLRLASETYEARLERLRRVVELHLLERRARSEAGPFRQAYERVRACEASGPWERPERGSP
ncbi:MAG TPA: hypothetical protein VFS00_15245 [Polyangiaceae bacterium]|nr:hypothetical protein [Polyangiaceae bacterium]